MKKLFALILAALMVLGCAAVASAEQEQTLELNWEDFEAEIEASEEMKAAWSGDFVTMDEIAMKLYIPASSSRRNSPTRIVRPAISPTLPWARMRALESSMWMRTACRWRSTPRC